MLYYEMAGFMRAHPTDEAEERLEFPEPAKAWLLLDFDGTLVDIADRPEGVVVPDRVRALLDRAMDRLDGRVALVSGRSIETLEGFLPDFAGALIGTHGAEMRVDGQWSQTVEFDLEKVARLQRLVTDFVALRPEFLAEPKPSGVVLHYRQAEEHAALAFHFMEALAQATGGFKLQPALMAYELKPEGVGKDHAIARLLKGSTRTPIYAGDDLTDEPALDWVQSQGGVGIKIGDCESVAHHRLDGPEALLDALEEWLA